jgi:phenylalanyl-tRNA synthetase beta chain
VLAKYVDELIRFANGKVASGVLDSAIIEADPALNVDGKAFRLPEGAARPMPGPESIEVAFINSRLGSELSAEEIIQLLSNVEFSSYKKDEESIFYWAPFWRMDIEIAEDIVEEVGRLYGYDKLPVTLPPRSSKPVAQNQKRIFKNNLRENLKQAGANEVLTYSFVHGDLLKKTGIDVEQWAYHLRNALSPDLQYYRPAILPSLLAKVRANTKAQAGIDQNEFALYEIGKSHAKGSFELDEPTLPRQYNRIAFVYAADGKSASNKAGAAYYYAKKYVDLLSGNQATYLPLDTNEYPTTAPYQLGRSAAVKIGDQFIGVVGEFRKSVTKALKLPTFCAGFEIDIDLLLQHCKPQQYKTLSIFPESSQDITFSVNDDISWYQLEKLLHAELQVARVESGYEYTIEPLDIYLPDNSTSKHISFRITLSHMEKTLKTEEVTTLLNQLASAAHETFAANRI